MAIRLASSLCLLLYFHHCVFSNAFDEKLGGEFHVMRVGEELLKESIPLKGGHCLYLLQGLKRSLQYEVKISYPASIPASFSIHLKQGDNQLNMSLRRRLLNTEKLIFEADADHLINTYILVTVEPAGIVALPNVPEREFMVFNIVCDELLVGIPYNAWWVGILALFCIGLAVVISFYFQPFSRLSVEFRELAFSKAS